MTAFAVLAATFVVPAISAATTAAEGAGTASTCTPSWAVVASPNPTTAASRLGAVAAVTATAAWAVGYSDNGGEQPIVERWDGTAWASMSTPAGATGARLSAVAARSASDVWAVGNTGGAAGGNPIVLRWDGFAWSLAPAPAPGGTGQRLAGVAVAFGETWVVGTSTVDGADEAFAAEWNGTDWTEHPVTAATASSTRLAAVAVAGADDVWAVGTATIATAEQAFVAHWNGTAWSSELVTLPVGAVSSRLTGVAVDGTDVWAVGSTTDATAQTETWTLRRTGSPAAWGAVDSPNPGSTGNRLLGIARAGAGELWAVGQADGSPARPIALHWKNKAWASVPPPATSSAGALNGAAAVAPDDVWAVGFDGSDTLIHRYRCPPPSATTDPAANVGQTAATLHGTVNPRGSTTSAHFDWGTTAAYGSATAAASVGSDNADHAVSAGLAGLTADTTYHYRVVAASSAGTTTGGDRTFRTAQPALSIADAAMTETDAAQTLAFNVTLSAPSSQTVTVNYATGDGTALAPADYAAKAGTLTFAPGDTAESVFVTVTGDALDEADEVFDVTLSGAANATLADATAIGTITDDDPAPALTVGDATVNEGATGASATATFTVTLSAASARTITVGYATADGTARAPLDYVAEGGSVAFSPGELTETITVTVNGDALDELDETFFVNLTSPVNATVADAHGVGTIRDDDGPPAMSVGDVPVAETDAATRRATFTIALSAPSGLPVTASYTTRDATAVAPADYDAGSGTVTFVPGDTIETVDVVFKNDTLDEVDETFELGLSNPSNATISDGTGVATIVDDDAPPTVSVNDVSVAEGDAGTSAANFTVSLSAPSGRATAVTFSTQDGTAAAPADYTARTATALAFAAGETAKTVTVAVIGDDPDENDEAFSLVLSSPVNLTPGDMIGTGTIVDDDTRPTVAAGPAADVTETSATLPGTVNPQGKTTLARFDWGATASYGSQTPDQTLSGTTAQPISRALSGLTASTTYHYRVFASSPAGTSVSADTQFTTPDPKLEVVAQPASVTETDTGTVGAAFAIRLSSASSKQVSVQYTTQDDTATAPADYATTSGTATFVPGQTTETVTVTIAGDTIDEENEQLRLVLSAPNGATLKTPAAAVTIVDNDPPHKLSVSDPGTIDEGTGGTKSVSFTVSLDKAAGRTVTVQYATQNGAATAPSDYAAVSGALTFATGEQAKTVTTTIVGDSTYELDETFSLVLSNAVNADVAKATGTVTIRNDDVAPFLAINDRTVDEGNAGSQTVAFTVTLCAPDPGGQTPPPTCSPVASGVTTTVTYATANGTASAPSDYAAASGTLTIPAGQASGTISVAVYGDTLYEADETFTVTLATAAHANIARDKATGTVKNDDKPPVLVVDDVSVAEGGSARFTITLCAPGTGSSGQACQPTTSGIGVSVNYGTENGNVCGAPSPPAVKSVDFTAIGGLRSIVPGESATTFTVDTKPDKLEEPDKRFCAQLTTPVGAVVGDEWGIGTIVDDDSAPTVSVGDVQVAEGDGGGTAAAFTVSFSNPSELCTADGSCGASVKWTTQPGTASSPDDFDAKTGTVKMDPPDAETFVYQLHYRVEVRIVGDAADEPDEAFSVVLSDPKGAAIASGRGTATVRILDDDEPPTAVTDAASEVAVTTATLNATVNPRSKPTSVRFEYGATTAYGSGTTQVVLGADTVDHAVGVPIGDLSAGATYHYRVVATSATGTVYGADRTFTQKWPPPVATTGGAASVTQTGAQLRGTVRTFGQETVYWFEYGTSAAYGAKTPESTLAAGGASERAVSAAIFGLAAGTEYHFRLVVSRDGVIAGGADKQFTTQARDRNRGDAPPIKYAASGLVTGSTTGITLACARAADGACRGVITLAAAARGVSSAAGGGKAVAVGRTAFTIKPGKTATVRVRLSAAAMRVLKRARSLRVTVDVSVRDNDNVAARKRFALNLRLPASGAGARRV